jgi:hypothetical protein
MEKAGPQRPALCTRSSQGIWDDWGVLRLIAIVMDLQLYVSKVQSVTVK